MGADIENPDPDGCVAAAEPSRNTLKERLVAAFLGTPNGAGGGDANDKAAKLANSAGGGDADDKEAMPPNGVDGGDTVADVSAANNPVKRGWRNYVLYVCGAIFCLVSMASVYPYAQAEDTLHMVLWGIGVVGAFLVAKICIMIADLV
jgi:hypothetical protein